MTTTTCVMQTRFGSDNDEPPSSQGNCFNAAFASLLGLQLDEVPEHTDDLDVGWEQPFRDFLADRGQSMWIFLVDPLPYDESPNGYIPRNWAPEGVALGVGQSPRGEWTHVVVVEDGIEIHDPYPPERNNGDSDPIQYFHEYYVIVPTDRELHGMVELPGHRHVPDDAKFTRFIDT